MFKFNKFKFNKFKLFCDGDPVALGIEIHGGVNIEKLGDHLEVCRVCQTGLLNLLFPGGLTKEEKEAFDDYEHYLEEGEDDK